MCGVVEEERTNVEDFAVTWANSLDVGDSKVGGASLDNARVEASGHHSSSRGMPGGG
jgi:hypothetical protein